MRLRARGNGKGTHEGCLCCIFARRRGHTFLVPLFGGVGQAGEGREGQTGVEENTGVTRFGRDGRILRLGGGIIVIGAQLGTRCGTAGLAGLGGTCGGGLPFVGRLRIYARTAIAGALVPMLVIVVLPGSGKGLACSSSFVELKVFVPVAPQTQE